MAKVTEAATELPVLLSPIAMSTRGCREDASHMAATLPTLSLLLTCCLTIHLCESRPSHNVEPFVCLRPHVDMVKGIRI
jgi:hypothetical protein